MTKLEILRYIMNSLENTNPAIVLEMIDAYKNTPVVTDESTLTEVFADTSISSVELTTPITVTKEAQLHRNFSIDGGNQKISTAATGKVFTFLKNGEFHDIVIESSADNKEWHSSWGMQFFTGNNTVTNLKVTGCNGALLVNGAKVTLKGTIDVSGNTFGGIEVSKGVGVENKGILDITEATLINTTEEYGKPTIWVGKDLDESGEVIGAQGMTKILFTKEDGTQQYHFYLNPENAVKPTEPESPELDEPDSEEDNEEVTTLNDNEENS